METPIKILQLINCHVHCFLSMLHSLKQSQTTMSGEQHCSFRGTRRLELMRNEIAHNTLSYSRAGPKELWPSISNYVLQLSSSNDSKSPVAFTCFID
ncbi:putative inactive purple acid phosphatase 16 [Camellia lanceoleosa]|uniref:Inactive purple acid phosphatase 16 n=1 Tax=Camellia lanceoleosa TaxID=1840588 RepID=A0ACC0IDQ0_9ERIC|nr:putative inactive purple acid phosphatase 16 [Camellia lanceoleosa]